MAKSIGKPNKIQTVPKRPTGSSRAGVNAHTGSTNVTKPWQPINVPMKGRLK